MIRNLLLSIPFLALNLQAADLRVGTYNVESSADTYSHIVSQSIRDLKGVDVIAIQELTGEEDLKLYTGSVSAGYPGRKSFRYLMSESGEISSPDRQNDHLAIIYNSTDLRILEKSS